MGSKHCFVCGQDNPKGLHVHFEQDGDGVLAHYLCEETQAGWPGIQHGGITSALLDEASAYVPHFKGMTSVTAELSISFVNPIRIGERLEIRARPTRISRRVIDVDASIVNESGEEKATSKAKMMVLSTSQLNHLGLENEQAPS